ncbi:MAG: hypothetical protein MJZ20_06520 [Bacteroidaceae bacterium]|nr:hypothetical protein [Bacteroidaceae bacterium]
MTLNYIWIALFIIGIIVGAIRLCFLGDTETMPAMMDATFDMANMAFDMTLGLTGMLTLWMGILKIGEDSGMVNRLARFLSPVLTKLFPDIPKDHPALGAIFMNISANMLGLDNAATPMGLKAMQELQSINPRKDTASNPMIMFLVMNTAGLTIIPVSIMAYRSQAGAADPTDVFVPLLLVTATSTTLGVILCALWQRINIFKPALLALFLGIIAVIGGFFWIMNGMTNDEVQAFCRVLTSCLILGAIGLFVSYGFFKKINVYESFIEGAKGGFKVAVTLIPYVVAILAAIGVFKASGALGWVQDGIAYVIKLCGVNSDFTGALPVALLKPLNGSGARGMMLEAMSTYGPDSFVGHLACIFQGSTDTTFYILTIYFGSVGIKKYRYSVGCGLLADLFGILAAIFFAYYFFY